MANEIPGLEFSRLITGLCTLTGFASPQRIIAGDGIAYAGVNFSINYKPEKDRDAILLYADFGCFDLEKRAMLYPLMLKENFMMASTCNSTFSVSESLDSVVLIEKVCLSTATPASLLALMRSLSHRVNYFNRQHRHRNATGTPNHHSPIPERASARATFGMQRHASG